MRISNIFMILSLFLLLVSIENILLVYGEDPTYGFTSVPLTDANFEVQKPYNIPVEQRYSFIDGVHRFWVYAHDKPYSPSSPTQPRTEIRIKVYYILPLYINIYVSIYIMLLTQKYFLNYAGA